MNDIPHSRWIVHGLASGVGGFIFGLITSLLITVLLVADVGWMKALERRGIDTSMRLAIVLRGFELPKLRGASDGQLADPITFIDIDEAGCRRLTTLPDLCRRDRTGQPPMLERLGNALRGSGAKAVLLDVLLPDNSQLPSPVDRHRLLQSWADGEGPPVVAVLPGTSSQAGALSIDWRRHIAARPQLGRLHMAAATVWPDARSGDAVVRGLPSLVAVDSDTASKPFIRNAPWLVARLANPSIAPPAPSGQSDRAFFSLPSLADPGSDAFVGRLTNNYDRRPLSSLLEPACPGCVPAIRMNALRDHIVILGSSSAIAGDWHFTPLGAMPGAEIMANAVRAAQAFPPLREAAPLNGLADKVAEAFIASCMMTVAWLLIARVQASEHHGARGRWSRRLTLLAIYLAGTTVVMVYSIATSLATLVASPVRGEVSDTLIPTIAVFFEGFVDAAKWIVGRVEGWCAIGLARLLNVRRGAGGQE